MQNHILINNESKNEIKNTFSLLLSISTNSFFYMFGHF